MNDTKPFQFYKEIPLKKKSDKKQFTKKFPIKFNFIIEIPFKINRKKVYQKIAIVFNLYKKSL